MAAVPWQSRDPFLANLQCSRQYHLGEKIACKFFMTNTDSVDYSVFTVNTPLEEMRSSYLSVRRNGDTLSYDGLIVRRDMSSKELYTLVKAGDTVSVELVISNAYAIDMPGKYSQYQVTLPFGTTWYFIRT